MSQATQASRRVKQLAVELDFALCGVTQARGSDYKSEYLKWIQAGKGGDMSYLARNVDVRLDPCKLLEGGKLPGAIVCVADYLPSPPPQLPGAEVSPGSGGGSEPSQVARYAQFTDYHKVIKKRLFVLVDKLRETWPGHQYKVCVDTAPVLEREHAARAGLGWIGKNTLLLNKRYGSHLLLGEVITSLEIEADQAGATPGIGGNTWGGCGKCRKCIDACPGGCISPYSVDASRCVSYLTIEKKGLIDKSLHESIGHRIFGCDVCQKICPFVIKAEGGDLPQGYHATGKELRLIDVLGWSESNRRDAFVNSAMKRAKLDQIKRNALIVAGNVLVEGKDDQLRRCVEKLAETSAPTTSGGITSGGELVRDTARQILDRLAGA